MRYRCTGFVMLKAHRVGLMYMINAVNISVAETYLCISILVNTGRGLGRCLCYCCLCSVRKGNYLCEGR